MNDINSLLQKCKKHNVFIKNLEARHLLEIFSVSSIFAILVIRFYLKVTGYPQLGGGGIHIAHMLWGGFLMAVAIVFMLSFLSTDIRKISAVIGGLGFGTFIDELGKFITSDNNYFYQPTIALLYILFIALYFIFRAIDRNIKPSNKEYLINTLEIAKEAVIEDLDDEEKELAHRLLEKADKNDPIAKALKTLLKRIDTIPSPKPGLYMKIKQSIRELFSVLLKKTWFYSLVLWYFVLNTLIVLLQTITLIPGLREFVVAFILFFLVSLILLNRSVQKKRFRIGVYIIIVLIIILIIKYPLQQVIIPQLTFMQWGKLVSSIVPGGLILFGIYKMSGTPQIPLRYFKTAVLIQIFLTQFFLFYFDQFLALINLVVNITVLVTINNILEIRKTE